MAMISFDDARQRLLGNAVPVNAAVTLPLSSCLGRVLAEAIIAPFDMPGFDNAAMDGYAVRAGDVPVAGTRLAVTQRIAAGSAPGRHLAGTAARIFTGAPVPCGADAVVMQEVCRAEGDFVFIDAPPRAEQFVRRGGSEFHAGDVMLTAGTRLSAGHLGLAAALGQANLPVWRPLRVGLFFTGSELVAPGQPLAPGQIYNSNRFVMLGMLQSPGLEVIDLGIVADDLEATRAALRAAAEGTDVILTSGGMSVGEEDHVKAAVEAEGALTTWKIAVKPGKPVAFGRIGGADFIGLPGNPVSVWVAFVTLVLPYLRKRQGVAETDMGVDWRVADFEWQTRDRREFLRVRKRPDGRLQRHANQDSGALSSAAWADGLADIPAETRIRPGDRVAYWPAPTFPA